MPSVLLIAEELRDAASLTRLLMAADYDEPWHVDTFKTGLTVACLTRPSVALVNRRLSGSDVGMAAVRCLHQLGVKVVYVTDQKDNVRRADPGAVILAKSCDPLMLLSTLQRVLKSASDRVSKGT